MSDASEALPTPAGGTKEGGATSWLWNKDLAPVPQEKRTWGTYNYTALWVSMSVNIPTYMLASGMIAGGMNWKQAIFTVLLGNIIVLAPMLLIAHAGAKYGIPFPVLTRASFGVLGANIPAILRALVACGWFGIQTWIGGQAINAMLSALWPAWGEFSWGVMFCFTAFWLINVFVIVRGIETIRFLQGISAPFFLLIGIGLLVWAYQKAGGFGPMLSAPSQFNTNAEFFAFFDFTRYAKGQREQMLGQALGLPTTMTLFAFLGVAVTSATVVIFGEAIWDPVIVLSRLGHPVAVVIAMAGLLLATLNVNIAANVVSPANDFSNLHPKLISFKTGGLITCVLGLLLQPWRFMESHGSYIVGWLVGYSSFLGPIAGVMIADYFVLRKKRILSGELYKRGGFYEFSRGFNWPAVAALVAGVALALPGRWLPLFGPLYDYAWFVGFGVAFVVYFLLTRNATALPAEPAPEEVE
jgi:NCS1 family nucleobase:cation symporter-1